MNRPIRFILLRSALLTTLLLCLVPAILRAQTPPPDPQAAAHRAHAEKLEAKNDYAGATTEYQQAYGLDKTAHLEDATLDLNKIGNCYLSLSQSPKALEFFQRELTLERQIGDKSGEAASLNNIGSVYDDLSQYPKALDFYQQALPIRRQVGDKAGEARTLSSMGGVYKELSQYPKALDYLQQSLLIRRQAGDKPGEATTLNSIGLVYDQLNEYTKALEAYQQALPIRRQSGDKPGEATTLNNIGYVYDNLSQYAKSLDFYGQALLLRRQVGDKAGEARTLNNMGGVYDDLSQYPKALDYYQQALPLRRQAGDQAGEAKTWSRMGDVDKELDQYAKALEAYRQSLPLRRQVGDKPGEAATLNNIGGVYDHLSQYPKALDFYRQALPLERQVGDKAGEAATLNSIGLVYENLSQYAKALDYLQQSLPIRRQLGDKAGEATTLSNMGLVYDDLSEYAKALDFFQQALPVRRQVGDKPGEATTLNNIGGVYDDLSQYARSLDFYQQALLIEHQAGDKSGEAATLSNIGLVYDELSQPAKALDFYQQALPIERHRGDKVGEAGTLSNIGAVYGSLSQYAKALDYYQQALPIARQIGDKAGEANTLSNIGAAYQEMTQYAKSLDFYQQALPIEQQIGDKSSEANTLSLIMFAWKSLGKPGAAVFYGKQAVNVYQSIRRSITTLDKQSQKRYLAANVLTYRMLADLLIQQGRLGEAEAVLALLKEAEYRDFNGTDRALATQPNAPVPLTADETQWQADYAALGDTLEHLNQQATELAKLDTRTPDQETQYRTLTAKLDKADAAFQTFLSQLAKHFQEVGKGNAAVTTVQQDQKMQNALTRWSKAGTRVAALYTVEADTQYAVILVTPNGSRPGATAITAADLNKKIEAFRQALTDPHADPRPLGQELYHILVGPIEKDLNAYDPQVLMWSLDGLIRYLPVAALYDGKGYLVERWQNTLFDPASLPDLDQTRTDWRQAQALGLGVSLEHHVKTATQDDEFPALTHVPEELDGIISDPKQAGASGVLPGQVRLDAGFTRQATLDALRGHTHPLVHIATHFRFDAAQAEQSYLLLGDGGQISLADLRSPGLFRDVDLLTLSACSTALGQANADGKEVDSLGRTAEDDGAQAVIASLWSVSDASTAQLMQTLYRDLQQGPSVSKAAALQAAQLSLLRGTVSASGDAPARGTEAVPSRGERAVLPPFVADPKAPYAHPFYWAPFILIGNWR